MKNKKKLIFIFLISFFNFIQVFFLEGLNPLNAPFSTLGNQIINSKSEKIRIIGVNWFGFESETSAPHGLWSRSYKDLMNQIKSLGFNTIRLPFNNQMFDQSTQAKSIDYSLNPDLNALKPLQILDKIVDYAQEIGLYIILDHHRSNIGAGPNENGLWYTDKYPESRFIQDWQMLARRYINKTSLIGADLHNEPNGQATWGNGNISRDWKLAAQKTGNAILSVNPSLLIIVEGIESYNNFYYWWGGNLMGVQNAPVNLNVKNKIVYSPHDYPNSVWAQPWFNVPTFPNNLPGIFRKAWGYIFEQNIAPIIVGEFGSKLQDPKDIAWISKITSYMNGDFNGTGSCLIPSNYQGISWTVWSLNPNSSDTGGILNDDWKTTRQNILKAISPIMKTHPCSSVPTPVPVAPTLNSITNNSTRNYIVSWNNVANATSYILQQATNDNFINPITIAQGNILSYSFINQANGTYYYRVQATNTNGVSSYSNIQNITINIPSPTPAGNCFVNYQITDQWPDGFIANVTIQNKGTSAITNWKLEFSFLGNQRIVNIWNGKLYVANDNKILITNESWNANIPAGATVNLGFQVFDNGLNRGAPTFALNGVICSK